jgi:hypothetical protein
MNIFKKFKAYLRLREAIRKADEAHAKDGARYYVIPTTKGELLITDRKNFRILKAKGYIHRDMAVTDLIARSVYFTPYKDGSKALSPEYAKEKREAYYQWATKKKVAK